MANEFSITSKDDLSEDEIKKIKSYFANMPISEILIGLNLHKIVGLQKMQVHSKLVEKV